MLYYLHLCQKREREREVLAKVSLLEQQANGAQILAQYTHQARLECILISHVF